MRNQYAANKMTERQLIETARLVMQHVVDDYVSGQLSKRKAQVYRDLHGDLLAELLLRGHQMSLGV